ncbi:hypothetical protein [Brevibacterium aurantiacum]|uniref:Lipoprotein n=1 Tax=Brevibacterium aurantiacum TaxID=273384 RepID=A0A2H1JFR5_BREAU|nr:hypothetical protein [Brevibacterium aurantiacum]SMX86214.1 hypothetical protein BAURA86_01645 [Brevibacterium aurantiacum]
MTKQLTALPAALAAVLALTLAACGQNEPPGDSGGQGETQEESPHEPEGNSGADGEERGGSAPGQGNDANEYPGEFTVANGDSQYYVGNGPHRPESVTVMCSEEGGVITATITESDTRNAFTTTQPEAGAGYAGGTLTLGDTGEEITWEPLDGLDEETIRLANSHPDARGDARVFEEEHLEGSPVTWEVDGTFEFGNGLAAMSDEATYEEREVVAQVSIPGRVDCSGGAAIN